MRSQPKANPYTYLGMTVSICPDCHRSVPASLQEKDNKIYMAKTCPEHGRFKTIVASDAEWYKASLSYTSPSLMVKQYQTETNLGCPHDCGICPEHQQNNALPAIEITNLCNLDCPICFADNQGTFHMTSEEMAKCLDTLEASETQVDALVLLGGEPTAHPKLPELIEQCYARPFIKRVVIATNGILIARRKGLAKRLAELNTYILLQLDSIDPEKNKFMRGTDMIRQREEALETLEKHKLHTTLLMTVIKGLNDDEIGSLYEYALSKDFIGGFEAQTMSYTGAGGRNIKFDPLDRMTGTDLIQEIQAQTDGKLKKSDFIPMLHPHPQCVAVTYVLKLEDGTFMPMARFTEPEVYRKSLLNQFVAAPDERHEAFLQQTIQHVFANQDTIEKGDLILKALRTLLDDVYPAEEHIEENERLLRIERHIKNVFLHNYMDDHSFDAGVLRKCASMQVLPDGRMIPQCGFRVLHRYTDPRWKNPNIGHGLDGLRYSLYASQNKEEQ